MIDDEIKLTKSKPQLLHIIKGGTNCGIEIKVRYLVFIEPHHGIRMAFVNFKFYCRNSFFLGFLHTISSLSCIMWYRCNGLHPIVYTYHCRSVVRGSLEDSDKYRRWWPADTCPDCRGLKHTRWNLMNRTCIRFRRMFHVKHCVHYTNVVFGCIACHSKFADVMYRANYNIQ